MTENESMSGWVVCFVISPSISTNLFDWFMAIYKHDRQALWHIQVNEPIIAWWKHYLLSWLFAFKPNYSNHATGAIMQYCCCVVLFCFAFFQIDSWKMQIVTTAFAEILCSVYRTKLNKLLLMMYLNIMYENCDARNPREGGSSSLSVARS